ncbi:ABC transporter related [Beutenbergia cavernae DSM 12333]|uniref:ABC transporter related n=1 Tax=Beutenbergia cavernae (strain ATCC BAA-8 / DSM 12333 / CCUG 43141 / JCM 11478 / NBRC 16432 / NCIMB 13614 / HKI 0122) TaxID=471853 RepID=C5C085_BEUC1|nr:ABC transporter ATP-binding protein [Beutenbergia cavernae]ACQ79271.1 ABC transporter related [Beutenbergia cavernae DSM 12333]
MTYRSLSRDRSVTRQKLAPGTVRRILRYARPYRFLVAGFLVLVVLGALLIVATPLLLQRIVDDGVAQGNRGLVIGLAGAVAVVALLEAGLGVLQRWLSVRIGEGLIFDLRTDVFAHVQRQSVQFFTRTQTGSLVTRLNSDVIGAQQAFTSTLSGVVSNLISVVVVLVTMFTLSWQITLLSLVVVPFLLLPARRVGRRLAGLTREGMQLNAELGNRMTERFNVAGAMLVKLFGSPDREDAEYADRAGRVRDIGVRTAMSSRVFFAALGAMAALATAAVYGVGGVLAIAGSLTIGALVAFAGLLGRLYGPVASLSNVQVDVMTALVSFERVFEVLDLQPAIEDRPDAVDLPDGPLRVELADVRFAYPSAATASLASLEAPGDADDGAAPVAPSSWGAEGEAEILHGVSLAVDPGHVLALVGPSGAGKTTIANLVVRLNDPTSGVVRIGGHDLRDVRQGAVHEAVGMVTQDAHMFHDTVRANLAYARPDASEAQMWDALRGAHVDDVVTRLPQGLETVVGERGHRLSGGEKQRLAIARLLLRAPRVVVLDEATAHLDSESEAAVQRALDAAMTGRTSIVIAHRLSTVRRADEIVVVDAGVVVERGTHAELLAARGLYAELYATQFAGADVAPAGAGGATPTD